MADPATPGLRSKLLCCRTRRVAHGFWSTAADMCMIDDLMELIDAAHMFLETLTVP